MIETGKDIWIEKVEEWQRHPVTISKLQALQAAKYKTMQQYNQTVNDDQFQYLRGLEIGYDRAIEFLQSIEGPITFEYIQIPVVVLEE
jgi:hypothetical protein